MKLTVPTHKFVGEEAILTCKYDLEGEELYSVKWYKDGNEFYRYIPGERDQKVTVFNMPGVRVDVSLKSLGVSYLRFMSHSNRKVNVLSSTIV